MNDPDALSDINAQITDLEATVAKLVPAPNPLPGITSDAALDLMRAIYAADPGVWLPSSQVVSYRHDRLNYRALQLQLARLVDDGEVQRVTVAQRQGAGRLVLMRLSTDIDTLDLDPIIERLNAELAPLAHRITVYPARAILSHFHRCEVATPVGTFTCYRRWLHWEPCLERVEPEQ